MMRMNVEGEIMSNDYTYIRPGVCEDCGEYGAKWVEDLLIDVCPVHEAIRREAISVRKKQFTPPEPD
jgi:hypothetical protein